MNRIVSKIGFAGLVSLALVSEAAQANTNTHGTAWHAYNASQNADIDYLTDGVRNIANGARNVIGPVGFHPPPSWVGGMATFYIDGKNAAGKTTTFSLAAFNWDGTVQSTVSTSSSAASYDLPVSLSNLNVYSYVSLFMSLPDSSGGVTLFRGVAVVQ